MPRKIRQLIAELRDAGFVLLAGRGKGDHSVWRHPLGAQVHLDGRPGDDAQSYQEKQARAAIARAREAADTIRKEGQP